MVRSPFNSKSVGVYMGTLQAPSGAEVRKSSGDDVINASALIDTSLVKPRLDAFKKIHATYSTAQNKVQVADARLAPQQQRNGELDATQDDEVFALANALAKDGFPRLNPLGPFSDYSASKLVQLGYLSEAREVHKLVKKVLAKPGVSKATVAAAKKLDATATQLEANVAKVAPFQKAHDVAIAQREALVPAWEAALAKLKRGARSAEDEGAEGLFEALFGTTAPTKKKAAKAPAVPPGT